MDTCISTSSMNHSNKFSCPRQVMRKWTCGRSVKSTRNNLGLETGILNGRQSCRTKSLTCGVRGQLQADRIRTESNCRLLSWHHRTGWYGGKPTHLVTRSIVCVQETHRSDFPIQMVSNFFSNFKLTPSAETVYWMLLILLRKKIFFLIS